MDVSTNKNLKDKYLKYKTKYKNLVKVNNLCTKIKNEITITLGNMHLFLDETPENKIILLRHAKLYNHDVIVNLLQPKDIKS